ncbi:MAG: RNA methyltransferase [Desulfobulbaceae bacterium]|nr:RNA methyltransferase [Desulfobulbaceae bacterium]
MNQIETLLGRISVILLRPKYPENIGSAARAAHNMGVERLVVIGAPLAPEAMEQARKTATHNAAHLLEGLRYSDSLTAVTDDYALLVGTTARLGRQRMPMAAPAEVAELIVPTLAHGPVALLFGPEDKGLSNEDLACCGLVTTIQTAAHFASINLAQAVAILCYELYQGLLRMEGLAAQGLYRPRAASREELASMFQVAGKVLRGLDQLSGGDLAETRLRHLRQVAQRCVLRAREAKLLKDTCRQVQRVLAANDE